LFISYTTVFEVNNLIS